MLLRNFIHDESAAITVDWVVLTAAIVGIAIAVLFVIAGAINTSANAIDGELNNAPYNVASLIGEKVYGNINDYTLETGEGEHPLFQNEGEHQHYQDDDGNEYRLEDDVLEAGRDGSGGIVGEVGDDGTITAPPAT